MAAISLTATTTKKSDSMTKLLNTDGGYHLLAPSDVGAHVRVAPFKFTSPAAGVAANDLIILGRLRKGAYILDVVAVSDAWTATADLDIGLVPISTLDDAGLAGLHDNTDGATAGRYSMLSASTLTEVTEDSYLVARVQLAGMAAAKTLKGYALFFENI
jgi:hypothetical protein